MAAIPAFPAPLRLRIVGPVADLATRQASRHPARWRPAIDGDRLIRLVSASAVLGVAAIAAIVSYSHIYELARHHGESGTAARLLPVSVDGLIASASLALLHAARNRINAPWMAYLMLWLGVGATIAANVGFGLPAGWLSAVIAAWPAMAFVGSVEMALMLARNERRGPSDGGSGGRHWRLCWWLRRAATAAPDGGEGEVRQPAIEDTPADAAVASLRPPSEPPPQAVPRPPKPRPKATRNVPPSATKAAMVDAALAVSPHLTNADIARSTGASERTVERRREAARKKENADSRVASR